MIQALLAGSVPADLQACRIAASLASVTGISPSSTRRTVATPTLDTAAKSRAVHRSMARASFAPILKWIGAFFAIVALALSVSLYPVNSIRLRLHRPWGVIKNMSIVTAHL